MSNGIFVKFPNSKQIRRFSSQRAVARMLSGNGTESGGLRTQISDKALNGLINLVGTTAAALARGRGRNVNSNNVVRNNALYG